MRFHYDKEVDALYMRFNEQKYKKSDEVAEGIIFDYDRNGKIIGIEILDASKRFPVAFQKNFKAHKFPIVMDAVRRVTA